MSLYIVFHKWYNIVKFDRNNRNNIYSEFDGNEDMYIGSFIEQIISNNIDHMNHDIIARMTDKKFINLKKYIIDFNNQKQLYKYKVKELIESIIKYFKVSNSCVILLFIYLWRLKNIYLNTKNWKNMIIAIMMVVVKWNEDWNCNTNSNYHLSNSAWAKFGNMSIYELNYLELLFCKDIKWKLFVTKNQFEMAKILIHMKYFDSTITM
jgi:hypothetical protein